MADYVDKQEFNEEMLKCVRDNKLTDKSIHFFRLIAKSLSVTYYFKYYQEREDAVDTAVADFASNWRGYKWKPVFKLKLLRNFKDNEKLVIELPNYGAITAIAKIKPTTKEHFKIELKQNKSLENLKSLIELATDKKLTGSLHKVSMKITFVDNINHVGVFGSVSFYTIIKKPLFKYPKKMENGVTTSPFVKPPPAFNWATSVARNGIIKSMDKMKHKDFRHGKMVNFSEINVDKSGMFDH